MAMNGLLAYDTCLVDRVNAKMVLGTGCDAANPFTKCNEARQTLSEYTARCVVRQWLGLTGVTTIWSNFIRLTENPLLYAPMVLLFACFVVYIVCNGHCAGPWSRRHRRHYYPPPEGAPYYQLVAAMPPPQQHMAIGGAYSAMSIQRERPRYTYNRRDGV